jgi:ankyrin repeat protein
LDMVKQLVAAGADRNAKSSRGLTPVDIARQRNKANIIEALSA